MAKEKDEPIVDVEHAFSKTELYFEENKKSITIIGVVILALVGLFLGYKFWYVPNQDTEAQKELFPVAKAFAKDSFNVVINGAASGNVRSAEEIADEYSVTPAGNLAEYMAGISYLRTGQYEKAIEHLKEFESDDEMVSSIALGATGDAYMELGNTDEAINYYQKAAGNSKNKFTAPYYLKKAGLAYEDKGNYDDAIKMYEQIRTDYSESTEGKDIDKYIARAKGLSGKES
jgi:tetratricopeptide (TPR) repeat protein